MENKYCYIIGAGDPCPFPPQPQAGDLVIAADGGFAYLEQHGVRADLVVGDFDSLGRLPDHPNLVKLNPIKDETDTLSAIQLGQARGYTRFLIYGGTGGRTAHTIANLQNLAMLAQAGQRGWLIGANEIFTVIHNAEIRFAPSSRGFLSVFSLSTACEGVCEAGLKYKLDHYTMTNGYPVGVSNEFIGEEAVISVENGTLLIIYTREATEL